jgi:hypothetical protein
MSDSWTKKKLAGAHLCLFSETSPVELVEGLSKLAEIRGLAVIGSAKVKS